MSFFAELGLSAAFTMISLAPMVPEWAGANNQPKTKINVMAGLPRLSDKQLENKEDSYKKLSYGGCAPDISLFNPNGDRVGYYKNKGCKDVIHQNNPKDLMAEFIKKGDTEKSEYITVSASGTDAICISAVVVTYPTSSDTYAFLPGEVAAVCKEHNPDRDYYWSESESTVQFKDPKSGKTQGARPKCLWIDKPDDDGEKATIYQGFQVHLPDFKLDNSTFRGWQDDPSNMCDALSRFGPYETLNVMMCPQVFSPAPIFGENLPLKEISACLPTAIQADQDKIYPNPCDDPRLAYQDRFNILNMYGEKCPNTAKYQWYSDCAESFDGKCSKKRRSIRGATTVSPTSNRKKQHRSLPNTEEGFPSPDHPLQRRFAGKLVKSWDITQSAVRVCKSTGSIGPDFYSEHEKMFCDMSTRTLYPACNAADETECFDTIHNETRTGDLQKRQRQKEYLQVSDWL